MVWYVHMNTDLQGGVQFPTGGTVREHDTMQNRCNSDTDSKPISGKVWMKEDEQHLCAFLRPESIIQGVFFNG